MVWIRIFHPRIVRTTAKTAIVVTPARFARHLKMCAHLPKRAMATQRSSYRPQPVRRRSSPSTRFAPPRCADGSRISVAMASARFLETRSPLICCSMNQSIRHYFLSRFWGKIPKCTIGEALTAKQVEAKNILNGHRQAVDVISKVHRTGRDVNPQLPMRRDRCDADRTARMNADIRILFTDVDMPGSMDGLRLAHAVRDRWPPVGLIGPKLRIRPTSGTIGERVRLKDRADRRAVS